MSEGGERRLKQLLLEGADAGAVESDVDQIEGLGEGLTKVPKPPSDADAAAERPAPSEGPK